MTAVGESHLPGGLAAGHPRQLHRSELSPAEVEVWLARASGLSAPVPSATGDLGPNGSGWLVNTRPLSRVYLRRYRAVLCCAGAGALITGWADLLAQHHPSFLLTLVIGALIALAAGSGLAARLALQHALSRAVSPARLEEVAPGTLVRLTGIIAAQPSVPTLFRGVPAVLFRDCMGGADEVRGLDFDLILEGGQQARVCVRQAFLLDRPTRTSDPPACGPVYAEPSAEGFGAHLQSALRSEPVLRFRTLGTLRESAVAPGDRVEVAGVLHHEPAPDATDPFARVFPTRFVLRAHVGQPLLVRRAAAAGVAGASPS
jgi:hypothetical protein